MEKEIVLKEYFGGTALGSREGQNFTYETILPQVNDKSIRSICLNLKNIAVDSAFIYTSVILCLKIMREENINDKYVYTKLDTYLNFHSLESCLLKESSQNNNRFFMMCLIDNAYDTILRYPSMSRVFFDMLLKFAEAETFNKEEALKIIGRERNIDVFFSYILPMYLESGILISDEKENPTYGVNQLVKRYGKNNRTIEQNRREFSKKIRC